MRGLEILQVTCVLKKLYKLLINLVLNIRFMAKKLKLGSGLENLINEKIKKTSSTSDTDTYCCNYINDKLIDKQYYMVETTPKQFQDCYDKWIRIGTWIVTGPYHRCSLTFIIQDQNKAGIFTFLCDSGSSKTELGVSIVKIGGNCEGSRVMASYLINDDGNGEIGFYVKPSYYGRGAIIKLGQSASLMYNLYSNNEFSSNTKNSYTLDQISGTKVYGS